MTQEPPRSQDDPVKISLALSLFGLATLLILVPDHSVMTTGLYLQDVVFPLTLILAGLAIALFVFGGDRGRVAVTTPDVFAVTDLAGRMPAARGKQTERAVSEHLSDVFPQAPQIVYRVLGQARQRGVPDAGIRVLERDHDGSLHLLHVSASSDRQLLWRVVPLEDVPTVGVLAHRDGPFAR